MRTMTTAKVTPMTMPIVPLVCIGVVSGVLMVRDFESTSNMFLSGNSESKVAEELKSTYCVAVVNGRVCQDGCKAARMMTFWWRVFAYALIGKRMTVVVQ